MENQPAAARMENAPFPVSPSGGKPGRVPPTPGHVSCQPKTLSRSVRRLPPQEGFQSAPLKSPLRIPLSACGSKEFYEFRLTPTGLLMEAATARERSCPENEAGAAGTMQRIPRSDPSARKAIVTPCRPVGQTSIRGGLRPAFLGMETNRRITLKCTTR